MLENRHIVYVNDEGWKAIKDLIPEPRHGGRHRTTNMRAVVDAILFKTMTNRPWRQLPESLPKWKTAYHYFREWRLDGTWTRIEQALGIRL